MKRTLIVLLAVALLLVTAHRLPAPISEIPENPTPAPEEQSKPKKTRSKSKTVEFEPNTESARKPSSPSTVQGPARFAGTWTGTINQGVLGETEVTLIVNASATSVQENSKVGAFTRDATASGNTMTWVAGWLNEITWAFTPAADGKTAAVTSKSGMGVHGASTFRRTSNAPVSVAAVTPRASSPSATLPTAKPVPDRLGFVYDPFDPTLKTLFDVRSQSSGNKVKDPVSGKYFIVP